MKKIREEIAAKEVGFFVFVIHGVVLAQVPTCGVAAACTDMVQPCAALSCAQVETQNLLNEIARVTVDSLNTKAHNQMLKDRHKQLSRCPRTRSLLASSCSPLVCR